MVLGKLPVSGRPTIWISVGQGPTALAVGAGGGCLDIFTLICPFFPLSPSLWETARYRLKYCLKGPLNPKPTNQPTTIHSSYILAVLLFLIICKKFFPLFFNLRCQMFIIAFLVLATVSGCNIISESSVMIIA